MLVALSVSQAHTISPVTKYSAGAEAAGHTETGGYFDFFGFGGRNGGLGNVYGLSGGLSDVYGLGGGATYNHYHYGGGLDGGSNKEYYG